MHPQTLRIYERKGLIDPYRTPGGTRRYSQEDIERLTLIQTLTSQGLNLEGVKQVLDLQTRGPAAPGGRGRTPSSSGGDPKSRRTTGGGDSSVVSPGPRPEVADTA